MVSKSTPFLGGAVSFLLILLTALKKKIPHSPDVDDPAWFKSAGSPAKLSLSLIEASEFCFLYCSLCFS